MNEKIPNGENKPSAKNEGEKINLKVISRPELIKLTSNLFHELLDPKIGIVLSGDRISCCDEGVIMQIQNKLIGVATIAPQGEANSGQPTIVGLYVKPEYRSKGYGKDILQRAIERCIERGFENIRMDVMSLNAQKIIEKLPQKLKEKIDAHFSGNMLDNF